ncbi:MAG: hypothetical protein LBN07_03400 [Christensenellaceae bacterium]|jgi:sporulation integral membrane protein YlbJ|nr:hypothetical protein [Christensenellaceae bacterium]
MKALTKKIDSDAVLIILLLFLIAIIAINPHKYAASSLSGLTVWATAVLPGLLPFCFITKILSSIPKIQNLTKPLGAVTKKLYNTGGISGYIFFMSIMSGYPLGSKLTAELFKNNMLTRGEAHRITAFSSTSGPAFVLGTVSVLIGSGIGVIIFISHIIGAVLNGLLYRKVQFDKTEERTYTSQKPLNLLNDSMYNTVISCLVVGGFITVSFVFIDILLATNILSPVITVVNMIIPGLGLPVGCGLVELTRGVIEASRLSIPSITLTALCSGLISFGGLSIHLQSMVFLKECNISYRYFALTKFTHAILSVGVCLLINLII